MMPLTFVHSFQSEWLKRKRSLASWLVITGSFFMPAILTLVQILRPTKLPAKYVAPDFWELHFRNLWESMNIMLLPMGIILAISLIAQLEYKNNTWKQLHATPQPLTTIFFAKLVVILLMQIQLFVLFNIGIYLSALIPSLVLDQVPYPPQAFPFRHFLVESGYYFIDSLPILAIQYLLALHFRNFLVSVGAGLVLLVTGIVMLSWEYSYIYPFTYGTLYFLGRFPEINLHACALSWFVSILGVGYVLYLTKREKG
jgi:lantibiotic transport system permease protein